MAQQLLKKGTNGYENVDPKTFTEAVKEKGSNKHLDEILSGFNSYFVSYNGSRKLSRLSIISSLRRRGLYITYILYNGNIVTEYYNGTSIDDASWGSDDNWLDGTNRLVGDISISSNGTWVINGVDSGLPARGEKGDNPILKVSEDGSTIQYSYNCVKWYDLLEVDTITPKINISKPAELAPGSTPTVENEGDDFNVELKFGLPKSPEVNIGSTTTIGEGNRAKVTNSGTKYVPVLNFEIPKGDTGRGINIKGFYPDLPTLQEKVTEPAIGDVYCVGTADPYTGYVWTNIYSAESQSTTPGWQSIGVINKDTTIIVNDLGDREDVVISQKAITDVIKDYCGSYEVNNEFIKVLTDAEGKIIVGIKNNGELYFPHNDNYKIISNNEWLVVWITVDNKPIMGVKNNGKFWCANSDFSLKKDDIANTIIYIVDDIEGRLSVIIDNDGKVVSYRDKNGVLHENNGIDTKKYFLNGKEKNFIEEQDVKKILDDFIGEDINISNLEGVSNHNTPNLLIPSEMEKTFNDGINSFTPPNEGYEMSNRIECKAGEWFTRTGTATAMIVVTDENDTNGQRLLPEPGFKIENTFQVPEDMTWVRYIRIAVQVTGANDGSVVICRGKKAFLGDNVGDFITIDKLKVESYNIPKELKYMKTSDGRFWETYVDDNDFTLKVREIDPDIITELPSDFKPWILNGTFDNQFDRMLIQNNNYFIEIKSNGVVKYKYIGKIVYGNYSNFEHFYNSKGEDRYGFSFNNQDGDNVIGKMFTLFDKDFNIIDTNIGMTGYGSSQNDVHDFIYIDDDHIILYTGHAENIMVPGDNVSRPINGVEIRELKKENGVWKVIGTFFTTDYPQLCTDAYGDLGNVVDSHSNTISLDYDGNLILNQRNWDSWVKIRRVENLDGTVTIGSESKDYNEAIIGRVGGRHNSKYIDSKRVLNDGFSFIDVPTSLTDVSDDNWEEWQWFHSHDVKFWGIKQIDGKAYPTYTIFDNNYWTDNKFVAGQYNVLNKHNNVNNNPHGAGNYYDMRFDENPNYAERTNSRIIQLSIDWDNHLIKEYRVYIIPKIYSREQAGATMYEEGVISIAYSYSSEFGLWDFTTDATDIQGNIYKGAKELFHGKYTESTVCYRTNTYKINN